MARPRKDAGEPGARERIVDAFWGMLEQMPLGSITVGALVEAAHCNRGTFYYYFADLDVLALSVVREEFFSDDSLARGLFGALVEGDAEALSRRVPQRRLHRMAVAIRAGERRLVEQTIRDDVQRYWEGSLCPEGGHLEPVASFAIQFMVGGMLGFIVEKTMEEAEPEPLSDEQRAYLAQVARVTLETVAHAQGMTPLEVLARVFREQ